MNSCKPVPNRTMKAAAKAGMPQLALLTCTASLTGAKKNIGERKKKAKAAPRIQIPLASHLGSRANLK